MDVICGLGKAKLDIVHHFSLDRVARVCVCPKRSFTLPQALSTEIPERGKFPI